MSTFNAISEEVKAEREIFFTKNPNPMWIYDPETLNIIEANEVAADLYGYSLQEMSSLKLKDLRPASEVSQMVEFIRKKEQKFTDSGIWKHQKKHGEPLYVHLFTYPLELDDKTYTLVVAHDVTRQNYVEHQLQTEHRLFQLMIDDFPGIVFLLDQDKKLIRWNRQVETFTNYKPDELRSKPLGKLFTSDQKGTINQAFIQALAEGRAEIECKLKTENAASIPYHLLINRMVIDDQPHLVGLGIDISSQRKAMQNLEIRSRAIENAMDAIAFVDNEGVITDVNKAKLSLYRYQDPQELIGKHWSILYPESEVRKIKRKALQSLEYNNQWRGKVRGKRSDGSVFKMELSITSLGDNGFVSICKDITEQEKQEHQIKKSLQEKEVMLTEIHHRVKNNLAVVSSMLQLQAFEEDDEKVRTKLLDSVLRIKSMATIHEQLYQAQSFSDINFAEHIKKLATNILEAHQLAIPVELVFRLDPVVLNVNQAVPCSLIINEVVTHTLKHAFRDNKQGTITFELSADNNQIRLVIRDNGKSLSKEFDKEHHHTLGHTLVNVLVQQLEADHEYVSLPEGTSFIMKFNRFPNDKD